MVSDSVSQLLLVRIFDIFKKTGFHHSLVVLWSFLQPLTSDLLPSLLRLLQSLSAWDCFSFFSASRRHESSRILHLLLDKYRFLFLKTNPLRTLLL